MNTRRKDTRYQARFPAEVIVGRRRISLFTEDLSLRGVFLRTDTPPALRQLVKVRILVPFVDRALEMHGMNVHVVDYSSSGTRTPGIGVQFYGLDRETREDWETTVRHVAASAPLVEDPVPLSLPADTPEPIRRRFRRHTVVLNVKPETRQAFDDIVGRDVPSGVVFIPTSESLKEGAPVMICLHHPENGTTFILDGKIRLVQRNGVNVEILGMDGLRRDDLSDFAQGGIIVDVESPRVESVP